MCVAVPVALVLLVADALATPAPLPRAKRPTTSEDDLRLLQGNWHRLSCTGGTLPPVPRPINDVVEFSGNRIIYKSANATWFVTLGVVGGKKTFDIKHSVDGQVWVGLYELNADTLRVCFTSSGTRPGAIEPSRHGEYLQVFRRKSAP